MTLALIRKSDNSIVSTFPESRGRVDLPGVGQVSPPEAGWEDETYRITSVLPAGDAPEGMQRVGSASYEMIDGVPHEVWQYEDRPPDPPSTVRKSTVQARLIEAGKMDAAYAMLTGNATYFARWFAPDRPVVNCDDPDAILVVTALELDPSVILAPEPD